MFGTDRGSRAPWLSVWVTGSLVGLVFSAVSAPLAVAVDPSPEAARIAKIAAPFVTSDTFLLAQADLAETDLQKTVNEALAKVEGEDRLKAQIRDGLALLTKYQSEFKAAGWVEVVVVFGCKFKADGQPNMPPSFTLAVRKSSGADTASVKKVLKDKLTIFLAPFFSKTAEQGDWVYFSPEDPRVALKKDEKKSLILMNSLFDKALAHGRGFHVAFMPQAAPRTALKKLIATMDDPDLPAEVAEVRKHFIAVGQALIDGKLTLVSLVDSPDPGFVIHSILADEKDAPALVNGLPKVLFPAMFVMPLEIGGTEVSPEIIQGTFDSLEPVVKPQAQGGRVIVSFKKTDGTWNELVAAGMKVVRALDDAKADDNLRTVLTAVYEENDAFGSICAADTRFRDDDSSVAAELKGKVRGSWRFRVARRLKEFGDREEDWLNAIDPSKMWDDPSHRAAAAKTPRTLRHPLFPDDPPGTTRFAMPRFPRGPYEGPKDLPEAAIVDGKSNTIAVVVLEKPVPWAQPGTDWQVDMKDPTKGLAVINGVITVGMLDGSIVRLKPDEKEKLKKMLTHDGAELIE